jgi:hypothetical protein
VKCSKCGGEVKNLPTYIEETGAELICSKCSGYADRTGETLLSYDKLQTLRTFSSVGSELDVAA